MSRAGSVGRERTHRSQSPLCPVRSLAANPIVNVGADAGFGFDGAGEEFHQKFVALLDEFAPRFGDGGASLGAAVAASGMSSAEC